MTLQFPPLEPWQRPVYDDAHEAAGTGDVFVVKSKRQVGKSCLAALLLVEYALTRKCVSVVVEPKLDQSRRLFKQICGMLRDTGQVRSANSQLLTLEFANGSEILFKSAEQGDALRGFTVTGLLVIDEAAFIKDEIFEILYPTCDANSAPILVISTPLFRSGEFYRLYERGMSGEAHVRSYDWSRYDTSKYLSREKLDMYRQTLSALKFRSEYLGEFISEGSYIFGDIASCVRSSSGKPQVAAIDWGAGNGGDFTVMILMDGEGCVTGIEAFNDLGPVEQVRRIAGICQANPTLRTLCVEMNSIGTIYCDMLRKAVGVPLRRFTTTNDTKRDIVEGLITAFNRREIGIPDDPELMLELRHYSVEKTARGYTYNGADGIHDDHVIALALAYDTYKRRRGSASFSFGLA